MFKILLPNKTVVYFLGRNVDKILHQYCNMLSNIALILVKNYYNYCELREKKYFCKNFTNKLNIKIFLN